MLLTITNTLNPATDLGYLLHKNPSRVQSFELSAGKAHVYYPEVGADRCTAALALDLDPVALVRGSGNGRSEGLLDQYVNDRPYVASSFLSVAIAQVFGSALAGRCRERPEAAEAELPLEAKIVALPCRGGEPLLRRLFEPLGYDVTIEHSPLDALYPAWGDSPYVTVTLQANCRLMNLLRHMYVLIPVLDDDKHYWVGSDEIEKLLRVGDGWLAAHPERETIAHRYLARQRSLSREALSRLLREEDAEVASPSIISDPPAASDPPIPLHTARLNAVVAELRAANAKRVLDLGCGEGRLLTLLLGDPSFTEIVGLDVSHRSLEYARDRLHLDRLPTSQRNRLNLIQGSLMYRDRRLVGYDGAAVVEVVEHLDPPRLASFERVLFEVARPTTIVLTTPNRDYNVRYPTLAADKLRHADHRFEWTRSEFRTWVGTIDERFGYGSRIEAIGPDDPEVGAPSQLVCFTKLEGP